MTKKIFKSIGLIALAVAVAIGSFFVPISKKDSSYLASANEYVDSNYYFHSNDTYYIGVYDYKGSASTSRFLLFNGDIQYTVNDGVSFSSVSYISEISGLDINYRLINWVVLQEKPSNNLVSGSASTFFNVSYDKPYRLVNKIDNYDFYSYVYCQQGFNANIYKVDLYLSDTNDWETTPRSDGGKFFNIKYFDTHERFFYFSFLVSADFYYNTRTYYFVNPSALSDSQYYNQGYNDGLADNQSNIYDSGYNTGYDNGFDKGIIQGAAEANNYSFFSLFGAIFDAPVTLFTSLLNFNFLGINLWSFITSLLTLAIILFVIKLFIRR